MVLSITYKIVLLLAVWLTLWGGALVGIWDGLVVVAGLSVIGITLLIKGMSWGGIFLGVATATFGLGFRRIPSIPPHRVLVTVRGKYRKRILDKNLAVVAPYFPFFYDMIPINIEQKSQDIVFDGLRCSTLGQFSDNTCVRIKIGIGWHPDTRGNRLYSYAGTGGESAVWKLLHDRMTEILHEYVASSSWPSLASEGPEIARALINALTNYDEYTIAVQGYPDSLGLGIVMTRIDIQEIFREDSSSNEQISEHELVLQTAVMLKKAFEDEGETRTLEQCLVEARRFLGLPSAEGSSTNDALRSGRTGMVAMHWWLFGLGLAVILAFSIVEFVPEFWKTEDSARIPISGNTVTSNRDPIPSLPEQKQITVPPDKPVEVEKSIPDCRMLASIRYAPKFGGTDFVTIQPISGRYYVVEASGWRKQGYLRNPPETTYWNEINPEGKLRDGKCYIAGDDPAMKDLNSSLLPPFPQQCTGGLMVEVNGIKVFSGSRYRFNPTQNTGIRVRLDVNNFQHSANYINRDSWQVNTLECSD